MMLASSRKEPSLTVDGRFMNQPDNFWSVKHLLIFVALNTALAVATSYFWSQSITSGGDALLAIGCFAVFLVGFLFQALLIANPQFNSYLSLLQVAGFISFFYRELSVTAGVGAILFVVALVVAGRKGQQDIHDRLKIGFTRFASVTIHTAITGAAIFIAFWYAGSSIIGGAIPQTTFDLLLSSATPGVRFVLPEFTLAMNVDAFLKAVVEFQVSKDPQFDQLSPGEQNYQIGQLAGEIKPRLVEFTNTPVESKESVRDYTYRASTNYVQSLKGSNLRYLPGLVILLVIFGLFKGVLYFVRIPVIYVAYSIYGLLTSLGIIYTVQEPRNKEIIMSK